jgi:tryptophan-rich sensory protein
MTERARSFVGLIVWLVLSLAAGTIGGLSTYEAIPTWYERIAKPAWTPPNWLFGPVWTVLYVLMGVAAWLVWRRGGWGEQSRALGLFVVQLVLNALWSYLFFGLRSPGLAFGELVVLWVAILLTLLAFWRVSRGAGALLVPYLAWVTFAGALNFAVWRLNA